MLGVNTQLGQVIICVVLVLTSYFLLLTTRLTFKLRVLPGNNSIQNKRYSCRLQTICRCSSWLLSSTPDRRVRSAFWWRRPGSWPCSSPVPWSRSWDTSCRQTRRWAPAREDRLFRSPSTGKRPDSERGEPAGGNNISTYSRGSFSQGCQLPHKEKCNFRMSAPLCTPGTVALFITGQTGPHTHSGKYQVNPRSLLVKLTKLHQLLLDNTSCCEGLNPWHI